MKKKTAIIILIFVLLISSGAIYFINFYNKETPNQIQNKDGGDNNYNQFFPTDNSSTTDPIFNEKNTINTNDSFRNSESIPKLRQIYNKPTAGYTVFDVVSTTTEKIIENEKEKDIIKISTTTYYRLADRGNGNIFETNSKTLDLKRISNTTIPQVYSALFSPKGESVIMTVLDTNNNIRNWIGKVEKPKDIESVGSLSLNYIPSNNKGVKLFDDNTFVYSILSDDIKYGVKNNFYESTFSDPNKYTALFSTPLKEIDLLINDKKINVLTNPSVSSFGYYYKTTKGSNNFEKVLGDITGLNLIENSKYIVFSESTKNGFSTFILNKETKETKVFPFQTLPKEKCIFSNKDKEIIYCSFPMNKDSVAYPDDWYLGVVNFNDNLYKIDLSSGVSENLYNINDPKNSARPVGTFDMTELNLSPQ